MLGRRRRGVQAVTEPAPLRQRIVAWIVAERWSICVFVAALAVRVHWNLVVHPLDDYLYSDMGGYSSRADRLVSDWKKPYEYHAFFPFGTHVLTAGFKVVFKGKAFVALGLLYAFFGALCVLLGMRIAMRLSKHRWMAPALGVLGILYYPHFSYGGYLMSETPFSAFMMLAVWRSVRLVDSGRTRDALGMGLSAGVAMMFRPQILAAVGLLGLFWLWRRKLLPKVTLAKVAIALVPLALCMGLSAAHFRYETGRTGLVSENGAFNMVFGRCHNSKIESLPDGKGRGKVHFRPPEFLQLNSLLEKSTKEGRTPPIQLDPVLGDVLSYKGYIGDREVHNAYIRECIAETSLWRQLSYAYTNTILLWRYNVPWPDSGRGTWRELSRRWTKLYEIVFALPSVLFLVTLFRRDTVRLGWVAVHLLALLLVSALYFGGTRHRSSYDFLLLWFAFEVYAFAFERMRRWWLRRRARPRSTLAPEDRGTRA